MGSVRALTISGDGKYLASVGLDRYARVYSTKTNKAVAHIYIKNRTNCVQFLGGSATESKNGAEVAVDKKRKARELDEEGDELAEIGSDLDDDDDDDEEEEEDEEDSS